MDENLRNRLIGEARFIRGLLYFDLGRFFGEVPIITSDTRILYELNVECSSVQKVYKRLIDDFLFASINSPFVQPGKYLGRATQGSARILLGKVYLTLKDWDKTIAVLAEVIDNEGADRDGLHENC